MSSSDIDLPPPRRKSCSECVKAKRRCSLRTPTCLRCAKRNLRCIYVGQNAQEQSRTRPDSPPVQVDFGIPGEPAYDFSNCLIAPSPMNDLSLNNLDLSMYSDLLLPLPNHTYAAPVSPSPTSSTVYSLQDYYRVTDICTRFVDSDLTCPSSRIAYSVAAMKNYHISMARTNSTPFLHPRLYSATTPASIVNAFTVCVLYVNKTPETEALVWRILDRNMMMLLDPMAQGGTELEMLARVQALILYQTIRIWDGGIRQRANAEAVMPVLEDWTGGLKKIRDGADQISIQNGQDTTQHPPSSWEVRSSPLFPLPSLLISMYPNSLPTVMDTHRIPQPHDHHSLQPRNPLQSPQIPRILLPPLGNPQPVDAIPPPLGGALLVRLLREVEGEEALGDEQCVFGGIFRRRGESRGCG
jgi:hypothetical protein